MKGSAGGLAHPETGSQHHRHPAAARRRWPGGCRAASIGSDPWWRPWWRCRWYCRQRCSVSIYCWPSPLLRPGCLVARYLRGAARVQFYRPAAGLHSLLASFCGAAARLRLRQHGQQGLEAAATLGFGPVERFFHIILPMTLPSFVMAAALGFAHPGGVRGGADDWRQHPRRNRCSPSPCLITWRRWTIKMPTCWRAA